MPSGGARTSTKPCRPERVAMSDDAALVASVATVKGEAKVSGPPVVTLASPQGQAILRELQQAAQPSQRCRARLALALITYDLSFGYSI